MQRIMPVNSVISASSPDLQGRTNKPTARTDPMSPVEQVITVIGFALLVCLRMPGVLDHGRFWAEDGNPFFQNAWSMPWYHALLFTWGGYLNFPANLGGVLARHLVPLTIAPYVTMGVGLLFQLCPAILLVTARDAWLGTRLPLAAAVLIVATLPASEEVWLTSVSSQCHLALCAALILSLDVRDGSIGAFRLALLLIAALSGPAAWSLIPLFAVRALLDRSWHRLVQGLVLAAGVACQVAFFFQMVPGRNYALGPRLMLLIFYVRHLLIPLLGAHYGDVMAARLHDQVMAGVAPLVPMMLAALALVVLIGATLRHRVQAALWLCLGGVTLAVVAYYGAIGGQENLLIVYFGGRYSFAPTVLFALALLALGRGAGGATRAIASALAGWIVVIGAYGYLQPPPPWFTSGPRWRSEVMRWRADPSRPLAIWPIPWTIHLAPSAGADSP
jgi:hypothetical protein